jgi:hypothetical protein
MNAKTLLHTCAIYVLLSVAACQLAAQRSGWRQATSAELASMLPSRAAVESEHIETEMRTASGIINDHGRFVAGVVLLTAGYSADGKYSHLLIVQVPIRISGILLTPGQYVFGWTRSEDRDSLTVHFNLASTGAQIGAAEAHRIPDSIRLESLHIWPPDERSIIQIGRFGIPYKLAGE